MSDRALKPDWSTLDERLIGSDLGNFLVIGLLGTGGMSTVYLAKEKLLDRKVALKVFPKRLAESQRDLLQAFLQDARTSSRIIHPNVITIFYVGYAQELYFVAMELMEGGSLRDVLAKEGALAFERSLNYCIQAARGLFCAHELGIVHRDVKPANLMLTKDGNLKVADFGLAHQFELDTAIRNDSTMGTPLYMAPELCVGNSPTPRSDIYALGVTLFSLLTNQRPYMANTVREVFKQHVESPIPDIYKFRPDLPPGVQNLLNKCMAKRPLDRYRTCAEVADELQTFLDRCRSAAGPEKPPSGKPGSSSAHALRGRTPSYDAAPPTPAAARSDHDQVTKPKVVPSTSRVAVQTAKTRPSATQAKLKMGLILFIIIMVIVLTLVVLMILANTSPPPT